MINEVMGYYPALFFFLCVCASYVGGSELIPKCCPKGEILDFLGKSCVTKNGLQSSTQNQETFQPPIDNETIYWLPDLFRNSNVTVVYGFLKGKRYDLAYTVAFDTENAFRMADDWGDDSVILIKREWFCFDETQDPNRSRVAFKGVLIDSISKCCGKEEVLNSRADTCVKVGKYSVNNTWFPKSLWSSDNSSILVKIRPKPFMNFTRKFNHLLKVKDGLKVKFIPGDNVLTTIHFTGKNESGVLSEGVTDLFCFDLIREQNTTSQVLLAAVYELNKCCGKGEFFSFPPTCTRIPGTSVEDVKNEMVDWKEDKRIHDWIPKIFQQTNISVQYGGMIKLWKDGGDPLLRLLPVYLFHDEMWQFEFRNDSLPNIAANLTFVGGQKLPIRTKEWCVERMKHYSVVLLGGVPLVKQPIRKCCDPGEVFSRDGYCEKHDGEDWSPKVSSVRDSFKHLNVFEENLAMPQIQSCAHQPYTTHLLHSEAAARYFSDEQLHEKVIGATSNTYYCLDFQKDPSHGELKEVLGSCTDPPNARSYSAARPVLGAATALLFVAAAAVAVARDDTRRSAHGRALACFSLCQAAANILQITTFFLGDWNSKLCFHFAYAIYFFMVSANSWLTAITFNMVKNFRKPLGALARAPPSASSVWRRFGIMAAFAWGVSAALTALSITMHRHRVSLIKEGTPTPTFSETRSCGLLGNFFFMQTGQEGTTEVNISYGHHFGPLFYYFIPMLVLVVVNTVSVVMTVRSIRNLGKDSAFVKSAGSGNTALNNVLLYVKLMITSGCVELILEVASWSYQSNQPHSTSFGTYIQRAYTFRLMALTIDLIRAICTFWLCMGTWCRIGGGGGIWPRVRTGLGRVPHVASNAWHRCLQHVGRNEGGTAQIPMTPVNNTRDS